MKIAKEIYKSFKAQPLWTVYSLLLCPVFYALVFLAAIMIGLINLSADDAKEFWSSNV